MCLGEPLCTYTLQDHVALVSLGGDDEALTPWGTTVGEHRLNTHSGYVRMLLLEYPVNVPPYLSSPYVRMLLLEYPVNVPPYLSSPYNNNIRAFVCTTNYIT